jgi:glyoxylase-like metal-dependent hydrolase (beta-lactamase superfamily II)
MVGAAMQLLPGFHMGEMTRGGRVYLVVDGINCVLIDTGGFDGTLGGGQLVEAARRRPHEVRMILLTHAHFNHAANAAGLKELTGAKLAASREAAALLADPPQRRGGLLRKPDPFPKVRVDRILEPGETIDMCGGLEVLDAPGHAPGSLAFHFTGAGVLCFGDAARVDEHGLHAPPEKYCEDPAAAVETAGKLAEISSRCLAPGHGYPLVNGQLPRRLPRH